MDNYGWILQNNYGYFRIRMDIMPAIDPAGNSMWFSALLACRGVQLDRGHLSHVLHIMG
jgi:hypothetical protein